MDRLAGHRIVRIVREEGDRRIVAAFGDAAVELHVAEGSAAADAAREAEALLAVDHPHLLPVLDVATQSGAVVLVRPPSTSTAAAWLLARGAPAPGEVVTVLAPVLAAVAALHDAGAHAGRIDLHAIALDEDGAPALVGAGAGIETRRSTDAWRGASPGVAADCAALAALVDDLLAAAGERTPEPVAAALERHEPDAAARALLAAWPALPLQHARVEPAIARRGRERARVDDAASLPVRWLQRALAQAATVRRPVWIAAAGGAAALVGALVLGGVGASDPVPAAAPGVSPTGVAAPVASTPPAPEASPVDAAEALLLLREACLDAGDDACLASVLDPSGGAAQATWRMPADAVLAEAAVLGDAVLVDVASATQPASVLVVRTDAGWMLRDAWAA
ncbi:hypothetical protein [Agrococcus sp. SGAir0287]|uniref:hypothetical protein n=1 Tax=Agrococcus sp. SGAir0287 TaxID=2070347 RepID=UPI0010CD537E|nr:hypothetical protein [Agrococcus sp. SGAir0287]QCR19379.1 hypothetical protein C1N71_08020 [Agrococcus sp. SGAir0287]